MDSLLPPELLRAILLPLCNDKQSLHSCILVSRRLFNQAVRLLYQDPLRWVPSYRDEAYLLNRSSPFVPHDIPFVFDPPFPRSFLTTEPKSRETFIMLMNTLRQCIAPDVQHPAPAAPYTWFITTLRTAVATVDFVRDIVPHCPNIDHVDWVKSNDDVDALILEWYRSRGHTLRSANFNSFKALPTKVSIPGHTNLRRLRINNTHPREPFEISTADAFDRAILAQPRLEAFELATSSPQTLPIINPNLIDALTKHSKTMTRLTLRTYVDHCEFEQIAKLQKLTVLDLHSAGGVTDKNMIPILRNCLNIEYLNLSRTKITTQTVYELSRVHRPALTALWLENMKLSHDIIPLAALSEKCPNLTNLDISFLRTSALDIHKFAQRCRNLEKLVMHRVKIVDPVDIFFILNSCPRLLYLDMSGINITQQPSLEPAVLKPHNLHFLILLQSKGVVDSLAIPFLRACRHLVYIDWSNTKITLDTIAELTSCPRPTLHEIILEGIPAFKPATQTFPLSRLAVACPHITYLDIAGAHTTKDEIRSFIAACPRIQTLVLDNCLDRALLEMVNGRDDHLWDELPSETMPDLTYLSVRGWNMTEGCKTNLMKKFSELHTLFFSGGLRVRSSPPVDEWMDR